MRGPEEIAAIAFACMLSFCLALGFLLVLGKDSGVPTIEECADVVRANATLHVEMDAEQYMCVEEFTW